MKQIMLSLALVGGLAACSGGNPFQEGTGTGGDPDGTGAIPEQLANNLESFTYNPAANPADSTLTIRGVDLEDSPFESEYRRRPSMDRDGFEAFTAQDGSLDRHSTAFVRDIRGTRAAVVVTGGQFGHFFSGGAYGNSGDYSAPIPFESQREGGLLSYAGRYVGILNTPGSNEDLLPVTPGTNVAVLPSQAAETRGDVFINASFSDRTVNGVIYNRRAPDVSGSADIGNIILVPTEIAEDGTFFGEATGASGSAEYGGIFGGAGATEVAGVVHAEEHIAGITNPIEYGAFVLAQCGTPQADPVCIQPVP